MGCERAQAGPTYPHSVLGMRGKQRQQVAEGVKGPWHPHAEGVWEDQGLQAW